MVWSDLLIPRLGGKSRVPGQMKESGVIASLSKAGVKEDRKRNRIVYTLGKAGIATLALSVVFVVSAYLILDTCPWIMHGVLHLYKDDFWIELDTRVNVKYENASTIKG